MGSILGLLISGNSYLRYLSKAIIAIPNTEILNTLCLGTLAPSGACDPAVLERCSLELRESLGPRLGVEACRSTSFMAKAGHLRWQRPLRKVLC